MIKRRIFRSIPLEVPYLRGVWLGVGLSDEILYQDQFGSLLEYTGSLNKTNNKKQLTVLAVTFEMTEPCWYNIEE